MKALTPMGRANDGQLAGDGCLCWSGRYLLRFSKLAVLWLAGWARYGERCALVLVSGAGMVNCARPAVMALSGSGFSPGSGWPVTGSYWAGAGPGRTAGRVTRSPRAWPLAMLQRMHSTLSRPASKSRSVRR